MPARRGLQQTALAATRHGARDKQITGGGQKLCADSPVLPVADSIFKRMYFASVLLDTVNF